MNEGPPSIITKQEKKGFEELYPKPSEVKHATDFSNGSLSNNTFEVINMLECEGLGGFKELFQPVQYLRSY
ncbi:MAG TPA: hypothetical protein VJR94_02000 [Candidatus Nitrosocosmicus sp.]|nr:hypothetical protein [Candidatus Nitrosocosmicus sp.]